jgi:hypothetical protein
VSGTKFKIAPLNFNLACCHGFSFFLFQLFLRSQLAARLVLRTQAIGKELPQFLAVAFLLQHNISKKAATRGHCSCAYAKLICYTIARPEGAFSCIITKERIEYDH